MPSPLRPLRLLCEQRPSIFSFVPEFLTPQEPLAASSPAHQSPRSQKEHLDTRYGLRLSLEKGQITAVRSIPIVSHLETGSPPTDPSIIGTTSTTASPSLDSSTIPSSTAESLTTDSPTTFAHNKGSSPPQPIKPRYSYRLFPDWQTSYLWYNAHSPQGADGNSHVDTNDIESRYPRLAPYYFDWQDRYESSFENQECHLGADAEVFPDPHVRAAWEVEGCLMACWLALQEDVEKVEYLAGETGFLLETEKVGTGDVLRKFIEHADRSLEN